MAPPVTEPRPDRGPQGLSTRAVHAGTLPRAAGGAVVNPVHQTTTFHSGEEGGAEVLYTRYGNNPNHRLLEQRICALEEAEACVVTGSGMGALVAALVASAGAGDHVLAAKALYGGTRAMLEEVLAPLGVRASYADFSAPGWEAALRPETRVVLMEVPTNPLLRVTDPAPLAAAARRVGAVLIADTTFATPVNLRALRHGVDLVVVSATKYLGGHTDVTAGVVCGASERVEPVRRKARLLGAALDPHAAWLLERGIKTLGPRMERHNGNGLAVARWCEGRPEIRRVHYPGLASHPDHEVAARLLDGFGGMLGIHLQGGGPAATRFVRALRLASVAPSLGGVETLVSEPRWTSHTGLSAAEREEQGIGDGFVRFSLGIEDGADIIADIEQALAAARA
jgi:cystathionine beta-lyase/cystathionine gamma-synthase